MAENAARRYSFGLKEVGIAVMAALVVGAALFAIGRFVGVQGLTESRAQMATERELLEQQITEINGRLQQSQNRMRLLEARVALFRAAAELDRRNFGTANQHVRQAGSALTAISDPAGAIDAETLRSLTASVAETDLSVARDLEQQRERLLQLAEQMESLIPPG